MPATSTEGSSRQPHSPPQGGRGPEARVLALLCTAPMGPAAHISLSQGCAGAAVTLSAAGDKPQHGARGVATKRSLSSQSQGL